MWILLSGDEPTFGSDNMLILFDCRPILDIDYHAETAQMAISCLASLARRQGEGVQWVFLADGRYRKAPGALTGLPPGHMEVVRAFPGGPARRFPGLNLWSRRQLSSLIKKYRPDLVITPKDQVSSGAEMPRVCFALSAPFAGASSGGSHPENALLAPGAPGPQYRPLTAQEKEKIRAQHTEGKEYFLALASPAGQEDLNGLLKAFSLFKKRQRSNIRLLIAPDIFSRDPGVLPHQLDHYKYRSEITIFSDPKNPKAPGNEENEEMAGLMGAAYAFISLSGKEGKGLPVLNAWQAGTPVVLTEGQLVAMAGEAAAYGPANDPPALAVQLMALYTNEPLRDGLIGKGRSKIITLDWERSAQWLWEGIERVKGVIK
jgi:glycosyltransferase involved in cell wall biosynthesis